MHEYPITVVSSQQEENHTACVPLSRGMCAIIDAADLPLVIAHCWQAHFQGNDYYAATNITITRGRGGRRKTVLMHRMLMGADRGQFVDHVNGNTLDNRRCNLRFCSRSQNKMNAKLHKNCSSKYKGVRFVKAYSEPKKYQWSKRKPWLARITVNGKRINLGHFETEVEAAKAYDMAALEHFGEFARPNFPNE